MNQTDLTILIDKFRRGNLSDNEKAQLSALLETEEGRIEIEAVLDKEIALLQTGAEDAELRELIYLEIMQARGEQPARELSFHRFAGWRKIAVAASLLLFLGLGGYWIFTNTTKSVGPGPVIVQQHSDIEPPDRNRAMITLADGNMVYLDSADNGQLAMQGNIKLVKLANGQIAYETTDGQVLGEMKYNTLSNPKGSRVIDMTLADGSRVWLDAGSSVTYPVAFAGNERKVAMTGQAYFEVAPDKTRPFVVSKNELAVTVLGTHFNVNAYEDEEAVRVTLLEGSVVVSNQRSAKRIMPGQQAVADPAGELKVQNAADPDQVMAWKNGLFSFSGADFTSVMRQLSRWYNIEIVYESSVPAGTFEGKIGRDLTLTQLLNGLGSTRINYKLEKNKLIILAGQQE